LQPGKDGNKHPKIPGFIALQPPPPKDPRLELSSRNPKDGKGVNKLCTTFIHLNLTPGTCYYIQYIIIQKSVVQNFIFEKTRFFLQKIQLFCSGWADFLYHFLYHLHWIAETLEKAVKNRPTLNKKVEFFEEKIMFFPK